MVGFWCGGGNELGWGSKFGDLAIKGLKTLRREGKGRVAIARRGRETGSSPPENATTKGATNASNANRDEDAMTVMNTHVAEYLEKLGL
ncbi:unnamed protein product [Ilex paraguariensis]|uniref:Uncharacterized protein n=1 Tax=Ilex paraguariensis TaxID=185542 RepID=A0ABC8QVG7_9AQUA